MSPSNCFFFYQVPNGEAIYLHPLCLKMLQFESSSKSEQLPTEPNACKASLARLPLRLENVNILEIESDVAPPDWLSHLPRAAAYALVEIEMAPFVSTKTYEKFLPQLKQRVKRRKQRSEKEQRYFGRVEQR